MDDARTSPPGATDKGEVEARLASQVKRLAELQELLYATDRYGMLVIFQAMDAAGKDGTIRAVFTGVNPAGCQVSAFKKPSAEELDHDFLWRHMKHLPERGRIGVFNRSWYEEVLVVRVHPEYLDAQRLPDRATGKAFWEHRMTSIADFERHLVRSGTPVVKFFLHVSKEEQRERLLARLRSPEKRWKFAEGDLVERASWDSYMHAYEAAIRGTDDDEAPWYVVPADAKPYARLQVAEILVQTLERLQLKPPVPDEATVARLQLLEQRLVDDR